MTTTKKHGYEGWTGGVDSEWAERMERQYAAARARAAEWDAAGIDYPHKADPKPEVITELSPEREAELDAMSRREEARMGRILRAAARRGAL